MLKNTGKKKLTSMNKIIALSGGFDPIHIGHVRMIQDAAEMGRVWIYLNTDEWLVRKKGFSFMSFKDRAEILFAIKGVEMVVPASDEDGTVCKSLEVFKPSMFGNGGDRKEGNTPEKTTCEALGIQMVFNLGGEKVQSSSYLVDRLRHV